MAMFKQKPYYSKEKAKVWIPKTWNGVTNFYGEHIWIKNGTPCYSNDYNQYILSNKETSTWSWSPYSTNGYTVYGEDIWIAQDRQKGNIYVSSYGDSSDQCYLNETSSQWESISFVRLPGYYSSATSENLIGRYIYKINSTMYYGDDSRSSGQYYDSYYSTTQDFRYAGTWTFKSWGGSSDIGGINGEGVWNDGTNTYYTRGYSSHYIFDIPNSKLTPITFSGLSFFYPRDIWKDGNNIYYSSGTTQYVLNKATKTWVPKTWSGLNSFSGRNIWQYDGHIYYSDYSTHYELI